MEELKKKKNKDYVRFWIFFVLYLIVSVLLYLLNNE